MKVIPIPTAQTVRRSLEPGQTLPGLEALVESGVLDSYQRTERELIAYSHNPTAAAQVQALPVHTPPGNQHRGLKEKARNFLLPTDLKVNCADEYVRFRAWSLAGATLSGVLGFMMSTVHLDSLKVAFSTSEKAVMAGVITGSIGKAAQMLGWSLAKRGDSDPKSSFMISSLIASGNAVLGLGLLAALPKAHLPWNCAASLTGTLGGIIGSAAGVNIFNHMASGPNKGEVATKNSNQDLLAGCLGMPGGVAMSWAARKLGMNPAILGALTLGPLLLLCVTQAAASIRMDAIDRRELDTIVDTYLQTGNIPEAPHKGFFSSLKELFKGRQDSLSPSIVAATDLPDALGGQPELAGEFRDQRYLAIPQGGQIKLLLRKEATYEDVVRAFAQAHLMEQALQADLPKHLQELGDADPVRTLIRLAQAALPEQLPNVFDLGKKGWHPSLAHLELSTVEAAWSGSPAPPLARLSGPEYGRLLQDPQALQAYLGRAIRPRVQAAA